MANIHHKIGLFLAVLSIIVTGIAYWWSQPTKIDPAIVPSMLEGPCSFGPLGPKHSCNQQWSGPVRRVLGLKIPINEASLEDLMALPGVGPGRAKKILQWREKRGPFQFAGDLQKVPGIGPKTFKELSPYISLRSASQ